MRRDRTLNATGTWVTTVVASLLFAPGCITSHPSTHTKTPEWKSFHMAACPQGLIDDLEDGDGQITKQLERDGYWFVFSDKFGSTIDPSGQFASTEASPESPARPTGPSGSSETLPDSRRHVRIRGKVAESGDSLYVGTGFAFSNPKTPYDLSRAQGVQFWAKGPGTIRFKTPDVNTDPSGDRCSDCYNDFGVDIYLSDRWERYTIPFEDMQQLPGWGDRAPYVARGAIFAIQWQFSTPGADYDISIDDVTLVGCDEKAASPGARGAE